MIFDVDDVSKIEERYETKLEDKDKEIKRLYHREKELKYFNDILESQNLDKAKEIKRLNNIINESAEEILKELEENHHLSYGVALAIRQKLLDYKELKGGK